MPLLTRKPKRQPRDGIDHKATNRAWRRINRYAARHPSPPDLSGELLEELKRVGAEVAEGLEP